MVYSDMFPFNKGVTGQKYRIFRILILLNENKPGSFVWHKKVRCPPMPTLIVCESKNHYWFWFWSNGGEYWKTIDSSSVDNALKRA